MLELENEVVGEQLQFGDGGSVLSLVVAAADPGRMLVVGCLGGDHTGGGCQHPMVAHQGQSLW